MALEDHILSLSQKELDLLYELENAGHLTNNAIDARIDRLISRQRRSFRHRYTVVDINILRVVSLVLEKRRKLSWSFGIQGHSYFQKKFIEAGPCLEVYCFDKIDVQELSESVSSCSMQDFTAGFVKLTEEERDRTGFKPRYSKASDQITTFQACFKSYKVLVQKAAARGDALIIVPQC